MPVQFPHDSTLHFWIDRRVDRARSLLLMRGGSELFDIFVWRRLYYILRFGFAYAHAGVLGVWGNGKGELTRCIGRGKQASHDRQWPARLKVLTAIGGGIGY